MTNPAPNLDRFLRRIHRRWSVIRVAERVGLSLLVSCIISITLSTILLLRGDSALGLIGACLGIGAAIGIAIGLLTRPTLFEAAVEVDRQLKLSDLLATALSIRRSETVVADAMDQQWSTTILGIAESRCAAIENEPLMLHRFGARAWGGIGLCTAIVLTLGALSTNPLVLRAGNVSGASSQENQTTFGMHNSHSNSRILDAPKENEPESAERSKIGGTDAGRSSEQSKAHSNKGSSAAIDHAGAGAGRTETTASTPLQAHNNTGESGAKRGELASGGGTTSTATPRGDASSQDTSTGIASDQSQRPVTPAWQSSDWPAAQQRAVEQLHHGDIPDAYRDLVRDYFAR